MAPAKWTHFYLYVIIDLFGRRVVGWHVADSESASLLSRCSRTVSPSMALPLGNSPCMPIAALPRRRRLPPACSDLDVTKSHSRPYTSNDNPFSESHFRTLKYRPQFPKRFGCIQDAKIFCHHFFTSYNRDYHHLGIGLMTPDQVHCGQADDVYVAR